MPRRLADDVAAATQGDPAALRRHLLEAAYRVVARDGLAAASARAVAREAGVSIGTLYNHGEGHTALLAAAIVHRAETVAGPAQDLPSRAGTATVVDNLAYFVEQAGAVLDVLLPTVAATFADPLLLQAVRDRMASVRMFGDPARTVVEYLTAEADLGRVRASADLAAAASVVVGLCHDDAFARHLVAPGSAPRSRQRELALLAVALQP